jgi:hypothetical protein
VRADLACVSCQDSGTDHLSEGRGERLEEQGFIFCELRHKGRGARVGHQVGVGREEPAPGEQVLEVAVVEAEAGEVVGQNGRGLRRGAQRAELPVQPRGQQRIPCWVQPVHHAHAVSRSQRVRPCTGMRSKKSCSTGVVHS